LLIIPFNRLRVKMRLDVAIVAGWFVALTLIAWFVTEQAGGLLHVIRTLTTTHPSVVALFPADASLVPWSSVAVFVFVQWWSTTVLDAAGPEAQRIMSIDRPEHVLAATVLPLILKVGLGALIIVPALAIWAQIPALPAASAELAERLFVEHLASVLPAPVRAVAFIALLSLYLSSCANLLNWGAGLVSRHVLPSRLLPAQHPTAQRWAYGCMFGLAAASLVLAFSELDTLSVWKLILGISAGVGPVFVLRWFWGRVNAWSQLSAMLGALILNLLFELLMHTSAPFAAAITAAHHSLAMEAFPFKLVVLTLLNTVLWLVVTFSTPPDPIEHLKAYLRQVQPGGCWPASVAQEAGNLQLGKRVLALLALNGLVTSAWILLYGFVIGHALVVGSMGLLVGLLVWLFVRSYPRQRTD
jgi:solute:Na+ symporter, SSS family